MTDGRSDCSPLPRGLRPFALLRAVPDLLRRPVATGSYRAEIDGLRFIAIAIVMVGHFLERATRFFPHAAGLPGGGDLTFFERAGLGVYLFFSISGFVIARQVIKAQAPPLSGRFLKSYFGRRVLRIEPPYVILLLATYLALSATGYRPENTIHFDVAPHSLAVSLATSVVYLHDLVWGVYPRLFPPGWSLEVEVQFYVLAPLLFFVYFKVPRGSARVAFASAVMFGASLLSLMVPPQIGPLHTHFSLLNFFRFFWLGIVLADLDDWIAARAVPARWAGLAGWLGLAVFILMPSVPDEDFLPAMLLRGVGLAALVAMFVGALTNGSSFRAFCSRPWVCLIGGACYSLYLTHQQAMQAMTSIAAKLAPGAGVGVVVVLMGLELVACIAIGLVFYAVIERTFMIKDWPQRLGRRLFGTARPNGEPGDAAVRGRIGAPRSSLGR